MVVGWCVVQGVCGLLFFGEGCLKGWFIVDWFGFWYVVCYWYVDEVEYYWCYVEYVQVVYVLFGVEGRFLFEEDFCGCQGVVIFVEVEVVIVDDDEVEGVQVFFEFGQSCVEFFVDEVIVFFDCWCEVFVVLVVFLVVMVEVVD